MNLPKILCKTNGASSTNGFTNGKVYQAIKQEGSGFVVLNDNGHERFETGRGLSPHLMAQSPPHIEWPLWNQTPVGEFLIIEELEK